MRLNTCPVDNQQTEFYGMMHTRTPGNGEPAMSRWYSCTSCPAYISVSDTGAIVNVRMGGWGADDAKKLFPTTGERKYGREK